MPIWTPDWLGPVNASGASVVVPNLDGVSVYEIFFRNGTSTGADGIWFLRTSPNADGSSPDAGASDYSDNHHRTGGVSGTHSVQGSGAVTSMGILTNTVAQWTRVYSKILLDTANGTAFFQTNAFLTSTNSQSTYGGGARLSTSIKAAIIGVSAGAATGSAYWRRVL